MNVKKMKLVVSVICMIAVGCTGGVGYLLYNSQRQLDKSIESIARLEQEVVSANEKAEQAASDIKKTEKKLMKTKNQLSEVQEEKQLLEDFINEAVNTTENTTTTTQFSESAKSSATDYGLSSIKDTELNVDLTGKYSEVGFGRVTIEVMYSNTDVPNSYYININGSSGAAYQSQSSLNGVYDFELGGITYTGVRTKVNPFVKTIFLKF